MEPTEKTTSGKRKQIVEGLSAGWPICLGYIPIGLAFGVLAQKAGYNPIEIGLMSLIVFAGSSQFIAISLFASGATAISIILTTFAVNLRHLLMSSSLAIYLKETRSRVLMLFAYGVTDESFGVNYARLVQGNWTTTSALTVNHSANLTWFFSTMLGGIAGQFIPEKAFGIDYALIAMFICLLVMQIRGWLYVITAILAGLLAVVFSFHIEGNFYIVMASMLAAAVGVLVKKIVFTG